MRCKYGGPYGKPKGKGKGTEDTDEKGKRIYTELDIPTTSYQNPLDVVMLPIRSPEWKQADNVRLWSAIHPSLLWEKDLHADLLRRLGENAD